MCSMRIVKGELDSYRSAGCATFQPCNKSHLEQPNALSTQRGRVGFYRQVFVPRPNQNRSSSVIVDDYIGDGGDGRGWGQKL